MTAPISDDLEDGIVGKGFPIEVYNVLGAGDAFMSGFLRGWLGGDEPCDGGDLGQCLRRLRRVAAALLAGNPTFEELQFFLKHGSKHLALRKDEAINHIHWATTRRRDIPSLMALACDHRVQLETWPQGRRRSGRIRDFKVLAVKAAARSPMAATATAC
jgi:5-dehydro-2-deoxygluconokinase